MRVRYLTTVALPETAAGRIDEVRDLPDELAKALISGGAVEPAEFIHGTESPSNTDSK